MGKGKERESAREEHMSRPLTTLKDPSSFGPPPKNVNYHGGAALPNKITPDKSGWGAPLSQAQIREAEEERQAQLRAEQEEEEEEEPAPPPGPYKADTTGLSTSHLPPPPIHRAKLEDTKSPVTGAAPKPKPSLPPRLPPRRQSSTPGMVDPSPASPPPAYTPTTDLAAPERGVMNPGSLNRLGKAGVSVPGFGIGGESNPWKSERSASPGTINATGPQLNELQSRFARMNATSPITENPPPSEGTTFAQKQAAMRTAQNFHKDPSSVTLSDARGAASTANNFRERHSDQIAAGKTKASAINQKYNISGRLNSFMENHSSPSTENLPAPVASSPINAAASSPLSAEAAALSKRKPPPPPPPKKPQMHSHSAVVVSPPPLPLGTKPRT